MEKTSLPLELKNFLEETSFGFYKVNRIVPKPDENSIDFEATVFRFGLLKAFGFALIFPLYFFLFRMYVLGIAFTVAEYILLFKLKYVAIFLRLVLTLLFPYLFWNRNRLLAMFMYKVITEGIESVEYIKKTKEELSKLDYLTGIGVMIVYYGSLVLTLLYGVNS